MKKMVFSLLMTTIMALCWSQNPSLKMNSQMSMPSFDDSKLYCSSTYTNQTDDWITNVTFNNINNTTGQDGPDSYGDYSSLVTGLSAGQTYNLSVAFVSNGYTQHVRAWFDWNGDEIFGPTESYYLGSGVDAILSTSITVPSGATVGWSRFRIIEQYSSDPDPNGACDPHPTVYGETEDYSVYISSNNNYCSASGGCDEYISEVMIESCPALHTFIGDCLGYLYWSYDPFDVPLNCTAYITVTNGNPNALDQCGIWVDWNNDYDFNDINETITVVGTPGDGPYTAVIIPPPGQSTGLCHLRVRITYNQTPLPCGYNAYGEVEDFIISLSPEVPVEWTGNEDNNWHNPRNWNVNSVPDASTDVTIPNTFNKCWVYAGTANCNNITVEYGSGNDLRIWDQELHIYGDMDFYGQLLMDHVDGIITVEGDVTWRPGSQASIQANTVIWVNGDWNFQDGANVTLNNGIVDFTGSGSSFIRSYEENCYFNDIGIYKSGGSYASISNTSTDDLYIHGSIYIQPNCVFYMYTPQSVFLQGDLYNAGSFLGEDGTLVFDGATQIMFENLSYATTQYFNNLTISSSGVTSIANKDLIINGSLTIESGQFNPNDFTLSIGWYWNNQVGQSAFVEGNGRVIFTGLSSHIYGNENFNILELNKSDYFSLLNIESNSITCQQYDWTNGSISVRLGGEFTAYDLIDDGIYGGWGVDNTGGTINIYNYDGYVDLNGYISMTGGVMNIYGGTSISYWPWAANATIHMLYEGVVDFHDVGIYIYDSPTYSLTENIGGGIIRTAGGFWGESGSFAPDEGTMEFYGYGDALIYTTNTCRLNDIIVNKGSKEETTETENNFPIIDKRSGKTISDGSKSNTLTLIDNLIIDGNLEINNGVLKCDGFDIQIVGNWSNYVGESGFDESTGNVIFVGAEEAGILTNEVFANVEVNRGTVDFFALEVPNNNVVDVTGDIFILDGIINLNPYAKLRVDDYLFIGSGAGLHSTSGCEIEIGGDYANGNPVNNSTQGFYGGGELVTFNGNSDQSLSSYAPEEYFTNLHINKSGGYFRPARDITVAAFFIIFNGDWWDQGTGLHHEFYGDFIIEPGGGYYPLGVTTFKGIATQNYENHGDAMFGDIVIDKSGPLVLHSKLVVFNDYTTTIDEGTLNLNGNYLKSTGNININDGGELRMTGGDTLSICTGLYVNNGGLFNSTGDLGNYATVWKDIAGQYAFEVNSGGSISANHSTFVDMNPNGIWVNYGAIIDPANAFNYCTFGAGENGFGAIRLTINNDQVLILDNVRFIDNPYILGSVNVGKYYDFGELEFTNFSGNFSGPQFEDDSFNRIFWINPGISLNLTVFLEGPFNGSSMNTNINTILPLNQPYHPALPYFGNPMPDWYYTGNESVGAIPSGNVVDWVMVELRDAPNAASAFPATIIARKPAFLLSNGSVVDLDGSTDLYFDNMILNQLFVVIMHRNHVGVISADPIALSNGAGSYNFSSGINQAYGGFMGHKELAPGIWGMFSGDGDGSGTVNNPDKSNVWSIQAGYSEYLQGDYNLNGQTNNIDKDDHWFFNLGHESYIPE